MINILMKPQNAHHHMGLENNFEKKNKIKQRVAIEKYIIHLCCALLSIGKKE